ncbi:CHAP domain-containing protein [Rathayibacter sp. VKM Ac-2801]|uniref:CHAP domain-containing protein n=1 Tax=Rathayibacter sp. VKM Ac-2801 TaxID=2609255 RepID=UPI00131F5810|nr:CHAP domain-containing protein [Rathayibacter sp. VKM Ac-2801]QHC71513.1 CHAP domain-containing protein [Rathayibacter sp. VKM Ac-2801]
MSKPGIPTPEESAGTPTTAPLTRREAREAERRAARAEAETGAAAAGVAAVEGSESDEIAASASVDDAAVVGSGSHDTAPSAGADDSAASDDSAGTAPRAVDAAGAVATAPTVSVEVPAVASPSSRSLPASPRRASASRPVAPRVAEPARARGLSRRALAFGTFSVVGGLFATAAIPAYGARSSSATATGRAAANRVGLQNLTVSSDAAGQTAVRDAFAAPTQAQLDEASRQAAVLSGSNGGEFSTVQTRAVGDDYPWPYETIDDDGGGLSPLGYYYRECVDFVAWRLNRDAGRTSAPWKYTWGNITPLGGSAYEWPDNWAAKGWATSSVPIVGCVAWWTYNHVSYVQKVNDDGTVLLEEYNYGGKHSYVTRTFPTAQVPLFLYPPVL